MNTILKIGLYTPKGRFLHPPLDDVPRLMAQHIDEPTGIYIGLSYPTEGNAYRFQPTWDFDHKQSPAQALDDARGYVESLTKKGIALDSLIPFASGRKGIHIAARHLLYPRDDWFEISAHAAQRNWELEFPTLDAGIYRNRNLIRAPWSRHAAINARKKPLPWDLFWRGEWAEIQAWAQALLNDAQYADIEALIRECLPTDEPMPTCWTPFADDLVLDFRQHTLTQKAIAAAKFFRPRRRFKGDWAAILDEAGIDHRERRNKGGVYFKLKECPYCHRSDKAWVAKSGFLRCFRTGCEAHDGIPANRWTEHLGVHLDLESAETNQAASIIGRDPSEHLLSAEEASARLRKGLERIHDLPPGVALLVMSTPGIGKTTHALEHVLSFQGKVLVAAATKQRALELYEQYEGDDAQLIQGRCEANCSNYERVSIVGLKGYLPGKVVCPGCPFFPANAKKEASPPCDYYAQFTNPPRVTFCTYEQALYLHEADRLSADLIVLDEDPSRAFMRKREIQFPHLQFNLKAFELPVRRFVRFLQHTLAIAAVETEDKHAVYRSRLLADLLQLSADQLGIDISKLLSQVQNCIGNVYDQPARLAHTEIEALERIPPAYLLDLAAAIREELSREEEDWNSTLSISIKRDVATLNFYQLFVTETQTPLVVLDAYGREEYYKALLNRPVETVRVDAKIHAKVIKIKLATSKRAFAARHDALFRRLDETIKAHEGRKILIYTHAAYSEDVQQRYPDAAVQHFWSGRGKDKFKDYDVDIIFGTAEPNLQALLSECRALYTGDSIPISAQPHPNNHRHQADERLETLLLMRREEEMEQAAHRPRPVWAEGNPKTIVVMSHLDLPGLPADEVIDPRAIQYQRRKDLFAEFMTNCLDQMGFFFNGLAEIAGIVACKSQTAQEFRQRLDSTGSLMKDCIRQPVLSSDSADWLYPSNRNAFYRDRDAILEAMELPSENLTFKRSTSQSPGGRVTIKVWGFAEAAKTWLEALVSDQLETPEPFTMADLLAACERYSIQMGVLLSNLPTWGDAYYRLFTEAVAKGKTSLEGGAVNSRMTSFGGG